MPMKSRFTVDDIIDAAFSISREEGLEKFSARAIAHRMQSSTMPIYSCLSSMRELEYAVRKRAVDLLISYATKVRTGDVFPGHGRGLRHVRQEREAPLQDALLSEATEESIDLRGRFKEYVMEALLEKLTDFEPLKDFSEEQKRSLLDRNWVFNHGLAMLLNNSLIDDLDEKQVAELLLDNGIYTIGGRAHEGEGLQEQRGKEISQDVGFEHLCEQKGDRAEVLVVERDVLMLGRASGPNPYRRPAPPSGHVVTMTG
jgi:AcrR family transcriptional regulator